MKRARILLLLGLWIAILPYLGFPSSWKSVLFSITGLGLIYFGYVLYREFKASENQVKTFDNFSENHDFNEKGI